MVSAIEGAIYGASVLLSTLAGALGIHVMSRIPGLHSLNDLSTSNYALYSALTGLGLLVAVILYRWPYLESTLTFGQIKGQSRLYKVGFDMDEAEVQALYRMTSFGDLCDPSSTLVPLNFTWNGSRNTVTHFDIEF